MTANPQQQIVNVANEGYVTSRKYRGCSAPAICPITLDPFFMWIEHPRDGWVPTYGGPFDSYTIPETQGSEVMGYDNEYLRERFDHDEGSWSEWESTYYRVTTEEVLANHGVLGSSH